MSSNAPTQRATRPCPSAPEPRMGASDLSACSPVQRSLRRPGHLRARHVGAPGRSACGAPLRRARGGPPHRGADGTGGQARITPSWAGRPAGLRLLEDFRLQHGSVTDPLPVNEQGGTLRVELNHSDTSCSPTSLTADNNDHRILAVARNLAAEGRSVTVVTKDLPLRLKASRSWASTPTSTATSWPTTPRGRGSPS